jgi:hypothetical protein
MDKNFKISGRKLKLASCPIFTHLTMALSWRKEAFARAAYDLIYVPKWEYKLTFCK